MRKVTNPVVVLLVLSLTSFATPLTCLAQNESGRNSALLPESWARKSALNPVLPFYPDEAIRQGINGIVRMRIETNSEGEIIKLKVKPGTDPLLSSAAVDAVKQWRFKPWAGIEGSGVPVFSRLAFHFMIRKGEPQVAMYDPGRRPQGILCLACSNSYREMIEWDEWELVWSRSEHGNIAPPPLP